MRISGVLLLVAPLIGCGGPVRHHRITYQGQAIPHLFAYTDSEVAAALEQQGVGGFAVGRVGRSGSGDRLLVFPFLASDGRVAVLSAESGIAVEDREWPLDTLCDQESFHLWYRGGKEITVPAGERRSPASFARVHFDPSCSFFSVDIGENETAVASTQQPSHALYIAPFSGDSIFCQAGNVYLFGSDKSWYRKHGTTPELICHVLRLEGGSLSFSREVRIPRPSQPLGMEVGAPYCVEDMSPFSEKVLLVDARDMPLWDRWVLFDIGTGRSTILGRACGTALFLADDILAAVRRHNPASKNSSIAAHATGRRPP